MSIDDANEVMRSAAKIRDAIEGLALNQRQILLAKMASKMAAGVLANPNRAPSTLAHDVVQIAEKILAEIERRAK